MSINLTAPGIYIEELPAASRTIAGVSTSLCAFIGATACGPVDTPTRVGSFGEFERRFGGLWVGSDLGHVVRMFFLNGGTQALIVRVVDAATAVAASAKLARGASTLATLRAANPGGWGNNLVLVVDHDVDEDAPAGSFNLVVQLTDGAGGVLRQESHLNVSLDAAATRYLPEVLDDASTFVTLAAADVSGTGAPDEASTPLVDGADGNAPAAAAYKGSESARTGLYALADADLFNLLAVPFPEEIADTDRVAFWEEAIPFCVKRRAFAVIDAPAGWASYDSAAADADDFLDSVRSPNAAVYFPAIKVADPLEENRLRAFPPCGAIAGVMARTDATRGVWKAPAGTDAALNAVGDVTVPLTDEQQGALNREGVNVLRVFPGFGRLVWGARTTKGADRAASEWKYVPVRRLALFLHESLYRGTRWAVFEPNGVALWAQLRLDIGSFLHQLFRQGAFAGATPKDAYFVKCDAETTTEADTQRGVVNVIIGFAPLKPAEFIVIKIQQIANSSVA